MEQHPHMARNIMTTQGIPSGFHSPQNEAGALVLAMVAAGAPVLASATDDP